MNAFRKLSEKVFAYLGRHLTKRQLKLLRRRDVQFVLFLILTAISFLLLGETITGRALAGKIIEGAEFVLAESVFKIEREV